MKWSRITAPLVAVAIMSSTAAAQIQTFEDTPCDAAVGAYGFSDYLFNWICYTAVQPPYTAHSDPGRVYTFDPTGKFVLTSPQVFDGAWFAGNDFATVFFSLYLSGVHVWDSPILAPTDVPAFLASGYGGLVDEIHVNSPSPDFYIMDDVTFNGATVASPEPATVALMATGLVGVAGMRLRRRKTKQ